MKKTVFSTLLLFLILMVSCQDNSLISQVALDFQQNLFSGDYNAAAQLVRSADQDRLIALADYLETEGGNPIPDASGFGLSVVSVRPSGSEASVVLQITDEEGNSQDDTLLLELEGEDWKVVLTP